MAKSAASSSKTPATAPAAGKKTAAFEIDDIFASKPKQASATTPASASAAASTTKLAADAISSLPGGKSKKKKGKSKVTEPEMSEVKDATGAAGEGLVRKVPEVIADPSAGIDNYRVEAPPTLKRKAGEELDKEAEAEERFMDSRGTISKWSTFPRTPHHSPSCVAS